MIHFDSEAVPDAIPSSLAGRLRQVRDLREMTNTELAELAGVRKNTVGDILSGRVESPGVDTVSRLCIAMRTHPSYVLLGIPPMLFEDSATNLQPVNADAHGLQLGVDQWLEAESARVTSEERAYLRAHPWPDPTVRQPDTVYLLALAAYRQSRSVSQASPDSARSKRTRK